MGGLYNKVQQIKLVLDSMRSFLAYANRKKESDGRMVKNGVEQVKDVGYYVEDIIGDFLHQFQNQRKCGFSSFLGNTKPLVSLR